MTTWTQSNFNGGEWSPLMLGRFNLDKYKTSVPYALNMIGLVQGAFTRRPGNRWVGEVKDSSAKTRLQTFEFSVVQAYALEFGNLYTRFFANDGQVLNGGSALEVVTPYVTADVFDLKFAQSADVLYIFNKKYKPAKLQRFGATNWTLSNLALQDGPYLPLNITATTLMIGAFTGSAVTVTASATTGINNDVGFLSTDIGRSLRVKNAGAWGWGTIVSVVDALNITVNVVNPFGGTAATPGSATLNGGSVSTLSVGSAGSGYAVAPGVTVGAPGGTGNIYALAEAIVDKGKVTALLVTSPGSGYSSPPGYIIAGPPSVAAPFSTTNWQLGTWSDTTGYPACGTFHEGRLWMAGGVNYPEFVAGSNVNDYENMAPTDVDGTVLATHSVSVTLAATDVNAISWILSDEQGLQVGTLGAEWLVRASTQQEAITPTNIQAKPSSHYGSSSCTPLKAGSRSIFIQRAGRKIRESTFSFQTNSFEADDISIFSEHLTQSGIVQMALQRTPQQIVWMCRSDGGLIGMTYEFQEDVVGINGHQVGGFSDVAHTVPALVESICCVPASDGTRDELWSIVNRSINGVTKRYVEVSSKIWERGDSVAATAFMDSSAQYSGFPTMTITGLGYLRGETVSVLADGSTHPDCVVASDGTITLQRQASLVQVGLHVPSDMQTHNMEVQTNEGVGQMAFGRIHEASIRLVDTLGISIGASFALLDDQPFRDSSDPMDAAPPLFSGDKTQIKVEDSYETANQLCVRQKQPLPFTVTMVRAKIVKN